MKIFDKDIDISRNIKIIEWLKSELLTDAAALFKALAGGMKEEVYDVVAETISNIILIAYLLAKRLGISYNVIEMKIANKIKLGIIENHEVEAHYGDLSELSRHLNGSREKTK